MTPALLVALAAFGLVNGGALMAWPVSPKPVRAELVEAPFFFSNNGEKNGPSTGSGQAEDNAPALYRRRILGAMIVGASLFLGGFTLAWELAR